MYLADEGGVVGVPEMGGQDVLGELLDFLHNKSFPIFGPANYVAVFGILDYG